MSAEKMLWQSVVLKAFTDATATEPSGPENKRAKVDADRWIKHGGRDFRQVCFLAGFDPDFIQHAYTSGRVNPEALRTSERGKKK